MSPEVIFGEIFGKKGKETEQQEGDDEEPQNTVGVQVLTSMMGNLDM